MTLSDLIDRLYVINLPERKDRKAQISAELKSMGIQWQANKIMCWPAIRPDHSADFPTIGAHGCFLSHLGALQDARQLTRGWILVLEDDAVLLPSLQAALPELNQIIADDRADLIYLGSCNPEAHSQSAATFAPTNQPIVGAHAYMVSRRFLDELLPYLQACLIRPAGHPLGGRLHFDGALSLFRQVNPACRTWLASHNLVEQRFSRSDIQPRWWYDQWPLVKQLAAWARQWKQFQRHVANKT